MSIGLITWDPSDHGDGPGWAFQLVDEGSVILTGELEGAYLASGEDLVAEAAAAVAGLPLAPTVWEVRRPIGN
jgi:hypothetical protein